MPTTTEPPKKKKVRQATVTKRHLIDAVAKRTGQPIASVRKTTQAMLDQIVEELGKGKRLEFRDFGVFETSLRSERTAQNPRTMERVCVPKKVVVKFRAGRRMKEVVERSNHTLALAGDGQVEPKPNIAKLNGHPRGFMTEG